jgi:spermidine synthase
VFTSGAVLLALEIIASRVLAPTFGNSVYIWGSLIGVFLGALSAGYYLGGRIADLYPRSAVFCGLVFLAGLLTVPIPLAAPAVLDAIVRADFGPRAGPLVAAVVLFFPASVVIGAISPYAVRLSARSVATVGNTAGRLYALSTLGGIVGCLAAAFWLLSIIPVREVIVALGLVQMGMATLGLLGLRRLAAAVAAAVAAVMIGAWAPRAMGVDSPEVIFARDTVYHRITISDEGGIRYMKLDAYWQSAKDLAAPERTVFRYADYMHAGMLFTPDPRHVLMIGMGGGTVPKRYLADYPGVRVDVVDIDPEVIAAAERYFDVPVGGRLRAFGQDGRQFVKRADRRYDQILMDAYLKDTIPFHLATREFFQEVRSRLSPGGVFVANIIGALDGPSSRLFRAIYRTLREVFPAVYVFPVGMGVDGGSELLRNIIVVGTDEVLSPSEVRERYSAMREQIRVPGFDAVVEDLYTRPIRTDDVPTLTDDYAPVDALIHGR